MYRTIDVTTNEIIAVTNRKMSIENQKFPLYAKTNLSKFLVILKKWVRSVWV